MDSVETKPKIAPKKLAIQLRRIVRPERPAEVINRGPFKAVSKVVGEERLLDEVAWLLFFAVDAGVRAGLAEHRELDVVRLHFFNTLRTEFGSANFDILKARNFEYQKAIKDTPKDRVCVGRRFAEFCGIGDNAAVALLATLLFKSTADRAMELVQKYNPES